MKSKHKVIIIVTIVIGLFCLLLGFLRSNYGELEKLRNERKKLIENYDSLQAIKLQKDSIIVKLIENQDRKMDSLESNYSLKYKKIRDEYKITIDNAAGLNIDSSIRLFSELISKEDSIK